MLGIAQRKTVRGLGAGIALSKSAKLQAARSAPGVPSMLTTNIHVSFADRPRWTQNTVEIARSA
jgi:hypothetical protein